MVGYANNRRGDIALVERIKAGDEQAIQTLFDQNQGKLYNFILGRIRDRTVAEDLVEETFIRGIFRIETYAGNSSLSTWLHTIARNATTDYIKRKRVQDARAPMTSIENYAERESGQILISSPQRAPSDIVGEEELHSRVRNALDNAFNQLTGKVGDRQRVMLTLRYYTGLTYGQIAEETGVTIGSVKCLLYRARCSLADKLKDQGLRREVVADFLSAA